jgi:hypothetical protein
MVHFTRIAVIIASSSSPCLVFSSNDFVDLSFTCPASTICPQVCAPTIEECPTHCPNNETLCANGSCAPDGTQCPVLLDLPCSSPCAPVACAPVIATIPSCFEDFAEFYKRVENCTTLTDNGIPLEETEKPDLLWTNSINLLVYSWVLLVTATIIGWCWYKYV